MSHLRLVTPGKWTKPAKPGFPFSWKADCEAFTTGLMLRPRSVSAGHWSSCSGYLPSALLALDASLQPFSWSTVCFWEARSGGCILQTPRTTRWSSWFPPTGAPPGNCRMKKSKEHASILTAMSLFRSSRPCQRHPHSSCFQRVILVLVASSLLCPSRRAK